VPRALRVLPIPRAPRRSLFQRWIRASAAPPFIAASLVVSVCLTVPTVHVHGSPCRRTNTEVGIQSLRGATIMFLAEHPEGGCPSVPDLVRGGYIDESKSKTTSEPWSYPMSIHCKGTRVTVTSAGPDGLFGTDDDID
jgi:hypothetical protein